MIDAETELVRGQEVWKQKQQILSVTARQATELGISDGYCNSAEELLQRIAEERGKPDGAANGQPIRSETNRTSSAAGSRR